MRELGDPMHDRKQARCRPLLLLLLAADSVGRDQTRMMPLLAGTVGRLSIS